MVLKIIRSVVILHKHRVADQASQRQGQVAGKTRKTKARIDQRHKQRM